MNNHITDEERLKRINMVYECIKDGMSTRECANHLTEKGISISNVTVKDYIERMKRIDLTKYNELQEIMKEHTPKTLENNEEVRTRVKNVVVNLKAGYTFEEIAELLGESKWTIYRDFRNRLNTLTEDELRDLDITKEDIVDIEIGLEDRSLSNLKNSK